MPARYILRLTLCVKFSSGLFGKILPPPRHSGLDVMPARARPVPFWRHGFLVEWRTSPRVLLLARALAAVGLVGDHDLVHQRLVVVAPEERLGRGDRLRRLALLVDDLEFHHCAPFGAALAAGALTLGRTITAPSWRPAPSP